MKKKINKALFWAPRIALIVFALFLAIFSLDVFDSASGFSQILIGLLMHNIPSFVLIALLLISWKHELRGGIIFMTIGIACIIWAITTLLMFPTKAINPISIIGSIVFLTIGALFLANHYKNK
ncbi:MAG: hypothetical protein WC852_01185 [Candidatus Nanoarchaeia archaeon]|jgi:hypothetical protein